MCYFRCNIDAQVVDAADHAKGGGTPVPGGSSTGKKSGGAWVGFLVFALVACALVGVYAAWWRFLASEDTKDTIRGLSAPVGALAGSLWGWATDKVRCIHEPSYTLA